MVSWRIGEGEWGCGRILRIWGLVGYVMGWMGGWGAGRVGVGIECLRKEGAGPLASGGWLVMLVGGWERGSVRCRIGFGGGEWQLGVEEEGEGEGEFGLWGVGFV